MNSAKDKPINYETSAMSNIGKYREQLTQQVAAERASRNEMRSNSILRSLDSQDVLFGSSENGLTDLDALRELLTNSNQNVDPDLRLRALGEIVSQSGRSDAHLIPLERFADPQEAMQVRLGALEILRQLTISSPTFSEWRSIYLEALRNAINTPELMLPAFEILISQGDRYAQEILVNGLEHPEQALVDPADALNFLTNDPHADIRHIARQIVDSPPDERALEAAIRHLAGDPSSIERLRTLINNPQRPVSARKLAVVSLYTLDPESLPVPQTFSINRADFDSETNLDPVEELLYILSQRR
ncbi:MAG: hypothetical protein AAFY50_04915 [Cyanobacteria bacterium J06648_1]